MRMIGLALVGLLGTADAALGQQQPAPHSGHGFFIWRNAVFVADDRERLRDGRAEKAMREARENVLAFERLRAASEVPPTAVARTDRFDAAPAEAGPSVRRAGPPRMAAGPMAARPARRR